MRARWGRGAIAGITATVALLFTGRWVAMLMADRWWAEAVDPAATQFLTQWHLLELVLELGGFLVAGAWCVGHFLIVVRSIGAVQVPRRLGDLEIRELLPADLLRQGAVLVGLLLGFVLGAGGADIAPLVAQAWHGAHIGVQDPVLGLDVGVYLVQLPLWEAALAFARHLTWAALLGAALCHFTVGGLRIARTGVAMTESARLQLGLLVTAVLLLAAAGEALAPLRAVAGLESPALAALPAGARWSVALAWAGAALAIGLWTLRPWPPLVLIGLGLWGGTGLLTHLVAPTIEPRESIAMAVARPVAALATGLDHLVETRGATGSGTGHLPGPGLWSREALQLLLQDNGGRLVSLSPVMLDHAGGSIPVWLAVRTSLVGTEIVAIADDRLSAGGAPVSYREGDPVDYPGVVSWRRLPGATIHPTMPDTVATQGAGGIPLGSAGRRLLLAWGTQTAGALGGAPTDAALWWRMAPRERASRLFPAAWWDEARLILVAGRPTWLTEGWITAAGAPLAPAIPWEGGFRRYARPAFDAVIDAATGASRFYLRGDADPVGRSWAAWAGGLIAPADSAPSEIRDATYPERLLSVQAWALRHGPFELATVTPLTEADSVLLRPVMTWGTAGAAPQLPIGDLAAAGRLTGRIRGVLIGRPREGPLLITWPEGSGPLRPRALSAEWQRFASYERLQDSVGAAGGTIVESPVRYEVDPRGALAVQVLYLVPHNGAPTIGWVNLATFDRLGAARTPATAWANLKGESAPVVPAPDLPDALVEARRWAARADSALRAGDLQGFGRAFEALKRVLGTP